jgi:hypothetical protein
MMPDHAAYKRAAGRYAGLSEALDLFEEVNKQLQER